MKIACLGWGSLIWDPRLIPIKGKWFEDGPYLPIEFARESTDGRITLVITNVDHHVESLWSLMSSSNLYDAKKSLAEREGISDKNIQYSIGFWDRKSGASHGLCSDEIGVWAGQLNLDSVVWTNLKYGVNGKRDIMPKCSDIIEHLISLPDESKKVAEEYICKAPKQIATEYRKQIQIELGWEPK